MIVDCSHMNAGKQCLNQLNVWKEVIKLRSTGDRTICGLMAESNLKQGCQKIPENPEMLKYGVSVTDECLGWEETENLLREV